MNEILLKKWWKYQKGEFSPNEFELMIKLYTGNHVNITEKITGYDIKTEKKINVPRETLAAKGYVIRDGLNTYGGRLTQIGYEKMNKIEKIMNLNYFQRKIYELNDYPTFVGLLGTIIGAIISIVSIYFTK